MTPKDSFPVAEPLAVIGVACLFPRASTFREFWANIRNGVDAVTEVPATHWRPDDYLDADPKSPDRVYVARGAFLEPVPFPPTEFGIAPNNLEATDTAQLLGLMVAKAALEDAGYDAGRIDRNRVGCILGVTGTLELVIPLGARLGHPIWRRALADAGVPKDTADDVVRRIGDHYVGWQENSFPGLLGNVVAGRIANRLDLGGTNCVVDAACASSLSAVHLAALELQTGRADLVVTGGVDTFNDIFMYMCFSKTPALSPTGDARPFDRDGDGTILGEGLGMVVLKRLSDARRDGDRVYAVLKGVGTSSDGKGNAVYAPRSGGQIEALRSAYRAAGITPDTIELVEAHGTGTRVGDATEVEALTEVFGVKAKPKSEFRIPNSEHSPWCALGSVKSQIGHTKAAAGAAGLIKAVAALHHKVLPPTIKVRQPLDALRPGSSPFYLNTERRPWMPSADHPRRAAVSAFGFGGSNFHCVLEEADPQKAEIDWDEDVEILALSAETMADLERQVAAWPTDLAWDDFAARAADARRGWDRRADCRLVAVVQRDRNGLARALDAARSLLRGADQTTASHHPDGVYLGRGPCDWQLAVLFPGQGSQYVGMMRDLVCGFPAAFDAFVAADQAFARRLADFVYPIAAFDDAARRAQEVALRDTAVAQPALGAVSLGAWRVLEGFGVRADLFAGHSYGELTALCAAGRLSEDDFLALSCLRGRLMAECPGGAMLAVHASPEEIRAVLDPGALGLTVANKNAPRQTVLSGPADAIASAEAALSARQVRASRLPVSAAFHSPAVVPAAAPLRSALESMAFSAGAAVFANSTAAPYPNDLSAARDLLANQLARPVDFVSQVERMYEAGARAFLEVGPGARLTALVGQILHDRPHAAHGLNPSPDRGNFADLAHALAWLASRGHDIDLAAWGRPRQPGSKSTAKSALVVPICGANYVKPRKPQPPAAAPTKIHPPTNGAAKPNMNGQSSDREHRPLAPAPAAPRPIPAGEVTTLGRALDVTRDSLAALQRMQEQAAQLHRQFLDGQDAAQRTVHLLVEQQQRLLHAALGLAPPTMSPTPQTTITPAPIPAPTTPAPNSTRLAPAPMLKPAVPVPAPDRPVPVPPPPPGPAVIRSVLLAVVSEKTGYPAEMLDPGMALDADLGIDSIKRVEILSALQDRLPHAPVIKAEHLGSLRTLAEIADFLGNGHYDAPRVPANGERLHHEPRPSDGDSSSVEAALLAVVSEKTGYPAEMLDPGMALDADLGIDSIKRVEILSALQDRLPHAPTIKSEHLGTLHTLRDVASFLSGTNGHKSAQPEPVETAPAGLERSVLRAVPAAPSSPRDRRLLRPGHEIWLSADDPNLAALVEAHFRTRGYQTVSLPLAALAERECPEALAALVLLAPPETTDAHLRDALRCARRTSAALRKAGSQAGAALLTVSRLDGAFGLMGIDMSRDPIDGGLAGLAKTAAREWPEVRCRALDLASDLAPEGAAAAIVDELFQERPVELGVARDGRRVLERVPLPLLPGAEEPLRPGDVVVVTGGARGVTGAAALALARAFRPTLVLVGRTPEPEPEPDWLAPLTHEADIKRALHVRANGDSTPRLIGEQFRHLTAQRELRHTVDGLAAEGCRVVYRRADVRDGAAVTDLLGGVRREFGPVRGLIHGAGVLADARIDAKTDEQFDRVYGTKVGGLRALLAGLEPEELRVLVLFSSSTARFGRVGQVDYAMANEVLNKYARLYARRLPRCRVVAVNWGPWDGGMVSPELKRVFAAEGVGVIPLAAGAEYLVDEIRSGASEPEVVVLGPPVTPVTTCPDELPAEAVSLPVAFEREVNVTALPVLKSHVLDGRPVLPMALMFEWLGHAALHHNPGLQFLGIDGLRVLQGVVLDGRKQTVRALAGKAVRRDGLLFAPVELRGARSDGREIVHARGEVVLGNDLPAAPVAAAALGLEPYGHSVIEAYASRLFHGPDLQGIEDVEGCGPAGIVAVVRTAPPPADWVKHPLRQRWLADPLALDCAFQMMILWSFERHGAGCLPCFAGRYRQFRRTYPLDRIRLVARVTHNTPSRVMADIEFQDADGRVIARLEGFEAVIDANLGKAFRRNRLALAETP